MEPSAFVSSEKAAADFAAVHLQCEQLPLQELNVQLEQVMLSQRGKKEKKKTFLDPKVRSVEGKANWELDRLLFILLISDLFSGRALSIC